MSGVPARPASFYLWRSEFLKQYAPGQIAATGTSVEEARAKVRSGFDAWLKEHREWWFNFEGKPFDSCDEETIQEAWALLEKDLSAEPEVHQVYFFSGSE
jgi:hypothetical protein